MGKRYEALLKARRQRQSDTSQASIPAATVRHLAFLAKPESLQYTVCFGCVPGPGHVQYVYPDASLWN